MVIVSTSGYQKIWDSPVVKEISNIYGTFVLGTASCYPVCIEVIHEYSDTLTMPFTPFLTQLDTYFLLTKFWTEFWIRKFVNPLQLAKFSSLQNFVLYGNMCNFFLPFYKPQHYNYRVYILIVMVFGIVTGRKAKLSHKIYSIYCSI